MQSKVLSPTGLLGSNPRRTEALPVRKVRVIRDDPSPEVHGRPGDDAVRDRDVAMATPDPACGQGDLRAQWLDVGSARDQGFALLGCIPRACVAAHLIEELGEDEGREDSLAASP